MISPHVDEPGSVSLCFLSGNTVNVWSTIPSSMTDGQITLDLAPDQAIVIGRQEGGTLEYLDPRYQPTQMCPGSVKPIVTDPNEGKDTGVSRGHFVLKGSAKGILLVNGVPKRGGGIRPPTNWTWMLEPSHRMMEKGEEFLIQRGASVKICLPNQAVIMIIAN